MRIDGQQPIPLNAKDEAPVAPAAGQPATGHDAAYVAKATKASVEFERFFISNMLKQMRSSTREMAGEDSIFKDRVNQDMQDMADDLLAGNLAGQRAFGIADAILRQLVPTKKT
ncbi:rod-binding protein [Massilia sp. DD77]|uniref:rod-binding protein n=1 Tax=Massilia sp. DD77 TaxID=3109349 RepID=UPI003000D277